MPARPRTKGLRSVPTDTLVVVTQEDEAEIDGSGSETPTVNLQLRVDRTGILLKL